MVWKNVRETYPELNLYAPDNAHPSIFGSYVAACTFYTAIYKESPVEGTCPKKIEDTHAKNIQEKAAEYTLTYYPMYNLDTLQITKPEKDPKLNFDIKEKWLSITIVNKSYGGSQYYWDFGDGNTSSKRTPKHYYRKPGKYVVTLYVKSNCTWYKLKKTIKVSDKVKHGNSPAPATKATN
jgi:PKD repeat protein